VHPSSVNGRVVRPVPNEARWPGHERVPAARDPALQVDGPSHFLEVRTILSCVV